ncbi:MAG: putative toxin-antitoxin system toxin component, PIN family [Acidobacteriaceae bacterium]
MRLIVLDTNVVVSAGINTDGPPAMLVDDWILNERVQIVTCPRVFLEYRVVVWREKFRRHNFPPAWLELMIRNSLQLPDPPEWPDPIPDAKDSPFLGLAYTAGAWLVTGNQKHFPKSACHGVTVVSPAEYLSYLTKSSLGS